MSNPEGTNNIMMIHAPCQSFSLNGMLTAAAAVVAVATATFEDYCDDNDAHDDADVLTHFILVTILRITIISLQQKLSPRRT
jgi:hypothetical protein